MGDKFIPLAFKDDTYRAVVASQTQDDFTQWELPEDDYWEVGDTSNQSSLEVVAQLFPPAAGPEADEPKAAQWDNEGYQQDSGQQEDFWASVYGFPDQLNSHIPILAPNETFNNTFEGGTPGVAVTVGNSGGASGDAFWFVDNTVTFDSAQPQVGSVSGRVLVNGGPNRVGYSFTVAQTTAYSRAYYYISGLADPPMLNYYQLGTWFIPGAGTEQPKIAVDADGKLAVLDANNSVLGTSTSFAPQERDFRVETRVTWAATGVGTFTVRLFFTDPNSSTPDETLGPYATPGMQAGAIGGAYFGTQSGGSSLRAGIYIDNVGISTVDWLGPLGTTRTFTERPSLTNYATGKTDPEFFDDFTLYDPLLDGAVESVTAGPPPAADDGYIAEIGLPDQTDFTEPDWEFSPSLEQNEGYLSPNDAFSVTIATQPLAEQPWFPDQDVDTELANDSTLDVSAVLAGPPLFAPDEVMAAQPLLEAHPDSLFPPDDPTNDQPYVEQNEAAIAGPPIAPELAVWAGQPLEQPLHDEPEPEYNTLNDGAVEVVLLPAAAVSTDVLIAAQLYTEDYFWPERTDWTEEFTVAAPMEPVLIPAPVAPTDRESVWGRLNRTQTNLGHPRHSDVILGRVLRRP